MQGFLAGRAGGARVSARAGEVEGVDAAGASSQNSWSHRLPATQARASAVMSARRTLLTLPADHWDMVRRRKEADEQARGQGLPGRQGEQAYRERNEIPPRPDEAGPGELRNAQAGGHR